VKRKLARLLRKDFLYITGRLPAEVQVKARTGDILNLDPDAGEFTETGRLQVKIIEAERKQNIRYTERKAYVVDEVGATLIHVSTGWVVS